MQAVSRVRTWTNPPDHPSNDHLKAMALFGGGNRDGVVHWFYRGQLRARIHLLARPGLTRSGLAAVGGAGRCCTQSHGPDRRPGNAHASTLRHLMTRQGCRANTAPAAWFLAGGDLRAHPVGDTMQHNMYREQQGNR